MRIDCTGHDWQEALDYFNALEARGGLDRVGLAIERIDPKTQSVYLHQVDDDWLKMQAIIESISALSTK